MGLVDEHFVICPWHQRRQDHRRYWRSQRRDSRVCHGPGRLESNTNPYHDTYAYIYVNANSDTYAHSYNYSCTYVYAYSYANGNCDGYSNCNPYSNSYSQAHTYTARCSYAAPAPDGGAATLMATAISGK